MNLGGIEAYSQSLTAVKTLSDGISIIENGKVSTNTVDTHSLILNGQLVSFTTGPTGPQGATGPQGPAGQSVNFYTPTVLTLIPGSNATVSDVITTVGNVQNHQLTLGIPVGNSGLNGTSFIYKGPFIQQTQYYVNDVVYIWGSSYICIQNTNSYIPKDDTGTYGTSYSGTIDNSSLYWKYIAHKGDKGTKGDKGDTGDSNVGLGILIGAIGGLAGSILGQALNSILNSLMDAFGNVPEPTENDRIRALARLIEQMQEEINDLQYKTAYLSNTGSASRFSSNLLINNGSSDRITLNNDGSSQFYGQMTLRNGNSTNVLLNNNGTSTFKNSLQFQTQTTDPLTGITTTNNNIILNADGTGRFTNNLTCDLSIACNALTVADSVSVSGASTFAKGMTINQDVLVLTDMLLINLINSTYGTTTPKFKIDHNGDLFAYNNVNLGDSIVYDTTTINSVLVCNGATTINSDLVINGNLRVNGNITCTGTMSVNNLIVQNLVDLPRNSTADIEVGQYFNQIPADFDNVIS